MISTCKRCGGRFGGEGEFCGGCWAAIHEPAHRQHDVVKTDKDGLTDEEQMGILNASWVRSGGRVGYKPGYFMEALLKAAVHADASNLQKIRHAWPVHGWAIQYVRTHGIPQWVVDEAIQREQKLARAKAS